MVVCQIIEEYQARGDRTLAYWVEARCLLEMDHNYKIKRVHRLQNANTDDLARLASKKDAQLLDVILVEFLLMLSIEEKQETMPIVVNAT